MRHPIPILVLALAAALVIAGCGGGDSSEPQGPEVGAERSSQAVQGGNTIAEADADRVVEAEDAINTRCGLVENQEGSDLPVGEAIRILADVYRAAPDAVFAAGVNTVSRNMERVVADNVAKLRGCGARAEADRLAGVLPA